MLKYLIMILCCLISINGFTQKEPIMTPGTMHLYFLPQIHLIANSPYSGYSVTNSGKGKIFKKKEGAERKYRFTNGEYLFFDWWFMPLKGLKMNLGYELTINYADTYYQPTNLEHDIHYEYFNKFSEEELDEGIDLDKIKERIRFWRGKIEYKERFIHTRLYSGYGHVGWEDQGDLFGFYPEQWDLDNYRRISAKAVPTAFETDWSMYFGGTSYGKLSFVAGPEPVWGSGDAYYAKYTYKYKLWLPTILFKYEGVGWGEEDETRWALALTSKYYGVRSIPLEGGVLYHPSRIDREYTVTDEVEPGEGIGGSSYKIETKTTDHWDALGFIIKGNTYLVPFIDKTTLTYTHLGKIAGNKDQIDLGCEKKIYSYYTFFWENTLCYPVEGPEIAISEGSSSSSPGPAITGPRSRDDAFWVNNDNREAFISSMTFIFDPTPGSWLFIYRPYILQLWNLNKHETSSFAFICRYRMTYYPGTTDLEPYKNSLDEWLWPGEYDVTVTRAGVGGGGGSGGAWPLTRPIHFLTIIGEFRVLRSGLVIIVINTGEELATNPIAYTYGTGGLIPMTRMFESSANFYKYPYYFGVEFGHNVWGPEYWYYELGGVVDRVYKVTARYNLNKNNEFEFQYTAFREIDNKYYLTTLGAWDEFRLSYKARFGTKFSVFEN